MKGGVAYRRWPGVDDKEPLARTVFAVVQLATVESTSQSDSSDNRAEDLRNTILDGWGYPLQLEANPERLVVTVLSHEPSVVPESEKAIADCSGFTMADLALPYAQWHALENERRTKLDPEVRDWLDAWTLYDLIANTRSDDERRYERRGHYIGWFDGLADRQKKEP